MMIFAFGINNLLYAWSRDPSFLLIEGCGVAQTPPPQRHNNSSAFLEVLLEWLKDELQPLSIEYDMTFN